MRESIMRGMISDSYLLSTQVVVRGLAIRGWKWGSNLFIYDTFFSTPRFVSIAAFFCCLILSDGQAGEMRAKR